MTNTVCRHIVYKLEPNAEQEKLMELHCRASGALFNYFLSYCKKVRQTGASFPSAVDLTYVGRAYRKENEWMDPTYANCMNMVARHLKMAIDNYFDRKKCGLKAGFPRYKSESRMDSFSYPDRFRFATERDKLNSLKFIKLPKIGFVKFHNDYRPNGRMVSATVFRRREGTRFSWYVRILYELKDYEYAEVGFESVHKSPVGIDLGLVTRIATSDGQLFPVNPIYQKLEKTIARQSRKLEKMKKGTKEYEKQRGKIGRTYKKARNIMNYGTHWLSRHIVFRYSRIFMEELQPEKMIAKAQTKERRKLYRDASWGALTKMIQYKAADTGTEVVFVKPMGTSQLCSRCGAYVEKEESERIHRCPSCGFVEDRDINAAVNILQLGLRLQTKGTSPETLEGWQPQLHGQGRESDPHESGKAPTVAESGTMQ